jgi:very-short-patch-repair endonuclease
MQAIIDHLEKLRQADATAEAFFQAHPHEPFFVKNLENVQGDERDVIFISTGYGRTADGYLAMNFGPLNGIGGERRLNVLITRARRRCEVFTNLLPDDIDLNRTQARGVQAFKTFLTYAQNGYLPDSSTTKERERLTSPFEEIVYEAVTRRGYQLVPQVGSAGFYIDFAVVDARNSGRYVLGISCDGANYHHARSARDRDRLRETVLTGLGWQIYHVWSTDWFRNPEAELQRLVTAIEEALPGKESPRKAFTTPVNIPEPGITRQNNSPVKDIPALPPYELANIQVKLNGQELFEMSKVKLADWVWQVVQVESPVHTLEVTRRIAEAAGVAKLGPRIKAAIQGAVDYGIRQGVLRRVGDILWLPAMVNSPLRSRVALPAAAKSLDLIAPEELTQAMLQVIRESYGIEPGDLPGAVLRLLGLARLTEDSREQLELLLEELLRNGTVVEQNNHIFTK